MESESLSPHKVSALVMIDSSIRHKYTAMKPVGSFCWMKKITRMIKTWNDPTVQKQTFLLLTSKVDQSGYIGFCFI